ncbi:TPA: hypothetical protein NG611_000473 [Vibrio parahaemolyticus]|uniref:hypothetical protein n=2 Tax=Vibrionaceae TaxID=641 RepID=UPI00046D55E3|nr:hypothetical protein [Vibrio parahaemolyticus]EGQ7814813.1 hypothetical protein [Vibrio parahaemolyticus]MCX4117587.1 hypothetical protein [Vibrio parahaemolyticus]HCE3429862.1 hypothetical protein [Vibrio parahaemolyticus]HCG5680239.1 hypothetical protein [Vibrio parahaemolyticus]HCG6764920.1 hypothetical protein [Vibrio parahaemolyticus]
MNDEYVTVNDFVAALELMNDVYLFDMLLGGLIGGVMGSFFTILLLSSWPRRDKELRSDDEAPSRPLNLR